MGRGVTVRRTEDVALIRSIIHACWAESAEDDHEAADWWPNIQREAYLLACVDDEPAGILTISSANASLLHVHINVLPIERKHRKDLGRAFLDYIADHSDFRAIIAYIPAIYRHVIRFALGLGFVNVGTAKRGFKKHGTLHDQLILQLELEGRQWAV